MKILRAIIGGLNMGIALGAQAFAQQTPAPTTVPDQWPPLPTAVPALCTPATVKADAEFVQLEESSHNFLSASKSAKLYGDQMLDCYGSSHHPLYQLVQAAFYSVASHDQELGGVGFIANLVGVAKGIMDNMSAASVPTQWQSLYHITENLLASAEKDMTADELLAATATPTPLSDPYRSVERAISDDPTLRRCPARSPSAPESARDILVQFACAYNARDYWAAEQLGDALLRSGGKLGQRNLYWLADAAYRRGNNKEALTYARQAYSHLTSSDKADCRRNVNRCDDLRHLLETLDISYRARFAAEDATIKNARREAAAYAAAAAQEAAATAYEDSGSGIHSTEAFHVNGSWELQWSYDCSRFSDGTGNFIVNVDGDVSTVLVNQLGSGDSGTEYVHQGGNVYLEINSECDWTVKAVND